MKLSLRCVRRKHLKKRKKVLTNGQNCGKIAERLAKGRENIENCIVQKLSQIQVPCQEIEWDFVQF